MVTRRGITSPLPRRRHPREAAHGRARTHVVTRTCNNPSIHSSLIIPPVHIFTNIHFLNDILFRAPDSYQTHGSSMRFDNLPDHAAQLPVLRSASSHSSLLTLAPFLRVPGHAHQPPRKSSGEEGAPGKEFGVKGPCGPLGKPNGMEQKTSALSRAVKSCRLWHFVARFQQLKPLRVAASAPKIAIMRNSP